MIYITGNAGYIGSYLKAKFKNSSGCDIGWFSDGNNLDFTNSAEIHDADTIIHLAGHSSEPMCSSDPVGAWENNVSKFKNLVESLRDDQTLIYASSASVYATSPYLVSETSFVSSSRPYDCTKIVCDTIAQMHINQGKKIIGLRLGTVAGSSPVQRVDTVINAMTFSALNNGTISCVDPDIRRTILFLPDLYSAIKNIINDPNPGIYNLGSVNTTIGEIASTTSKVTGASVHITSTNKNFYDFHLDTEKFLDSYGSFQTTTIEKIIVDLRESLPWSLKGRRDAKPDK